MIRKLSVWILVLLVQCGIQQGASADGLLCANEDYLGRFDAFFLPSAIDNVAVLGDTMYAINSFDGIVIADISDLNNPILVDEIEMLGGLYELEIVGSYGYMGTQIGGLTIFDLSDPRSPVIVSETSTGHSMLRVEINAGMAYTASSAGIDIFDVSDPMNVAVINSDSGIQATDVDVDDDGEVMYSVYFNEGLRIHDISDPTNPALLGLFPLPNGINSHNVVYQDGFVYMTSSEEIWIMDVSDPANPVLIGMYGLSTIGSELIIDGDTLYCAVRNFGVLVLDVSDPTDPQRLGFYRTYYHAEHIALQDGVMYISDDNRTIRIVDVSDPKPSLIGEFDHPENGERLRSPHLIDGLMYCNSGFFVDLVIYDMADPDDPVIVSEIGLPGEADVMDIVGGIAYIGASGYGLIMVDVSDPAAPVQIGAYEDPTLIFRDVCVVDGVAYTAAGQTGVVTIDVSDPTMPSFLGRYNSSGIAEDVDYHNGLLFLADGTGDVRVLLVTDPSTPIQLIQYNTPGSARALTYEDGLLYVSLGGSGLRIYNAVSVLSPVVLSTTEFDDGYVDNIVIEGDTAYLTEGDDGIRAVDISDPTMPISVGSYRSPTEAHELVKNGDLIYSTTRWGMITLDVSPCAQCDADLSGDGVLDFFDISAFLTAFSMGDLIADFSADGSLDFFDISAFLTAYSVGCP